MNTFKRVPANPKYLSRRKVLYGFGINDADYNVTAHKDGKRVRCPIYTAWANMVQRCYSGIHPAYGDCVIYHEWASFTKFLTWADLKYKPGFDLDKDLKCKGNKIYSPETCLFVPHSVNTIILRDGAPKGKFKLGVTYDKRNNNFTASVSSNNKRVHIGKFESEDQAHFAYKVAKNKQIDMVMKRHPEFSVYLAEYKYSL